jgi:hypothetical protein
MIKPTNGRVVWFWPLYFLPSDIADSRVLDAEGVASDPLTQPQAAMITWVWGDDCVNLVTFDANGVLSPKLSVCLYQGEGDRPTFPFCEWMPYQVGQAAMQAAKTPEPA